MARCCTASGVLAALKDYCDHSSLHGMRFISDTHRPWIERLFWVACCLLSWGGAWLLMLSAWDDFWNSAVSFATDTDYIGWNTDFPSVVICEEPDQDRITDMLDGIVGEDRDFELDDVYWQAVYFNGKANLIAKFCTSRSEPSVVSKPECIEIGNLTIVAHQFRKSCKDLLGECRWRNVSFQCCEHFLPLSTESGECYAFNNIHARESHSPLDTKSNISTGPGDLFVSVQVSSYAHVLPKFEVPLGYSAEKDVVRVKMGTHTYALLSIKEVVSERGIRDLKEHQRRCRLTSDGLRMYSRYSYGGCVAQCRMDAQARLCNCSSHFSPNPGPDDILCNISGLVCLDRHYSDLNLLKDSETENQGIYCPCLPSCDNQEINTVYRLQYATGKVGSLKVELHSLPTVRYKRNVVRSKMDLVVSLGGTCGLLVGASLLSFVEIVYFLTLRPCGPAPGSQPPPPPPPPPPQRRIYPRPAGQPLTREYFPVFGTYPSVGKVRRLPMDLLLD